MNISPVPLLRFVSRLVRRDEKDSWTMARVDAEGGLRWISGSVKRDGEVRRGEKEARREWKKIYWPEHGRIGRIYIYTYVAREINITLWILRSLWKPCQVNKSIKFSHFIGRARVYDWSLRRAEEGESVYRWREMKGGGREKGIYKIKRSLRIRGRLTLPLPPIVTSIRPTCPILVPDSWKLIFTLRSLVKIWRSTPISRGNDFLTRIQCRHRETRPDYPIPSTLFRLDISRLPSSQHFATRPIRYRERGGSLSLYI